MTGKNTLSEREVEILQLVASGLTNREIAQTLSISPNTVKVHLRNIFEKINVASRTEATLYGIEHGLVDIPGSEESINQPSSLNMVQNTPWLFLAMILVIVLIVAFSSNALFSSPTPTPVTLSDFSDRWEELTPIPEPRAGMAAITYSGNIYAIAGEGPQGVSGSVFRYETSEDRWDQLKDKPIPVADVEGVLVGEKIYIPGGRLANGENTDVMEVYDPRKDTWERKASLPTKISGYGLASFEGQIYLFGGWDGEKILDIVLRYDPIGDNWESMTSMPTARANAGAAEVAGKIYVIGGWDGEEWLEVNESYTPTRESAEESPWETLDALPVQGSDLGVQSIAGIVFVISEDSNGNIAFYQYKFEDNSWSMLTNSMDKASRENMGITNQGGIIFMIGGSNERGEKIPRNIQYQAIYTISLPGILNQ